MRPPLRSLRWLESFLQALTGHGFSDEAAVAAYRAYTSFLLGHLLLESATVDVSADVELDDDIEFFETNDLSRYPRLMALQDQLRGDGYDTEFEDALEDLLDRIELVFD